LAVPVFFWYVAEALSSQFFFSVRISCHWFWGNLFGRPISFLRLLLFPPSCPHAYLLVYFNRTAQAPSRGRGGHDVLTCLSMIPPEVSWISLQSLMAPSASSLDPYPSRSFSFACHGPLFFFFSFPTALMQEELDSLLTSRILPIAVRRDDLCISFFSSLFLFFLSSFSPQHRGFPRWFRTYGFH